MRPSILFHPPDDTARERASFFTEVQRQLDSEEGGALPAGRQATTILDLMVIRASHGKILRRYSLGTAVGFRMRKGSLTDVPAILVFVSRKVNRRWLLDCQVLPTKLVGPGGIWCDVDVVEFSYFTSHASTSREQVYTELVEGLRGSDPQIGPGSQVSSQETYGTLGTIVRSRIDSHQVGFLTNRHVAVDLDYASQKMFHPLPPNLGPGVCLGVVERTTSFVKDKLWYGIFASRSPETFVRADGAFVPFADSFDLSKVTTSVKGVGDMGEVIHVDLQAPIGTIIGKPVVKVGRSSGLTKGMILAYALEYNDDKGICYFTDFLVIGEDGQTFDLEGDSGSLILIVDDGLEKPRPIGIIWGGTENRGRLKLKDGLGLCSWTGAVDLGRLLNLLELDLVTRDEELQEAMEEKECLSNAASVEEAPPKGCTSPITSTTGESRDIH